MVNYIVSDEELEEFVGKLEMFETTEHVNRFLRFVKCSTVPPTAKERDEQVLVSLAEQWKSLAKENEKTASSLIRTLFKDLDPALDTETDVMDLQCPACLHFKVAWVGDCGHMLCHTCALKRIKESRTKCIVCNSQWISQPIRRCYF
tara:strand:+ start:463 stop:903 length:441 start_codon:yes stop_codon:yes gene_type:complete